MCHALRFSARALIKENFFDVDIMKKKINRNVVFRGLYYYRQPYASLLFSQTFVRIVSVCSANLQKFLKDLERKVWRVQAAHFHNAARSLFSRCFQLSQIVVMLDIVLKNKSKLV